MNKEEIANVLKNTRINSGMTQTEVSTAINRPQQTIASWETGKSQPDADTLFQLFDLYGQSVDEAFGYVQKQDPKKGPIYSLFAKLNAEGQERLIEYAEYLVASGRYEEKNNQPKELSKDA